MPSEHPIRVAVVDDRSLARIAARAMLEDADDLIWVGECASGSEGLALARSLTPDVILMDVEMPGTGGPAATRRILADMPSIRILAWSVSEESADLLEMLAAGCVGYVLKDVAATELHRAIRVAMTDDFAIPRRMVKPALEAAVKNRPSDVTGVGAPALTKRELDVLRLLARGLATKEIAKGLGIASASVDSHQRAIYRKLDVGSRGAAVRQALRLGLVTIADL